MQVGMMKPSRDTIRAIVAIFSFLVRREYGSSVSAGLCQ